MKVELLIEHEGKLFMPAVKEGIQWTTERVGSPSILKFTVIKGEGVAFTEGDPVRLKVDDKPVFFGFVFSKKRTKTEGIDVTAYDQLRYLKNKDTYVYESKTASQVIQMIAADFRLNVGALAQTSYVIPSRVEDNQSLFDIIQSALDLELTNRGELYCLYDDFGKLTLKNIANMKVGVLIDDSTAEDIDYTSSIDQATYDKIKLTYDNEDSGKREVYIAQDGSNINRWGVLQYYETLQKGENGVAKAEALLKLYNAKTRNLTVKHCLGDVQCRAGAMPIVKLNLGDIVTANYMLIEKAVHTFDMDKHLMDLTLRGGEFVV